MIKAELAQKNSQKSMAAKYLFFPLSVALLLSLGRVGVVEAKLKVDENNQLVVVHESRPHVARAGVWQTYRDHIHLKAGQEKKQLVLTFTNGSDGRPKMTDLRISIAGKPFATIKDFDENGKFSRSLNGVVTAGDTVVATEVFGPSGARIVWKLYSEKPAITSVQPNPFGRDDKLTVLGNNFSDNKHSLKVTLAGKTADILAASAGELQIKVPPHIPAGEQSLIVTVDSAKSNAFKVIGRPNIYWLDITSTSPSQPVMILGRGFSKVASENEVAVGPHKARVVSATETNLTFIVPEMPFPQHHLPLTVTTNGVASKDLLILDVDMRVIPNILDAPKVIK